jgi:hypothetical protein
MGWVQPPPKRKWGWPKPPLRALAIWLGAGFGNPRPVGLGVAEPPHGSCGWFGHSLRTKPLFFFSLFGPWGLSNLVQPTSRAKPQFQVSCARIHVFPPLATTYGTSHLSLLLSLSLSLLLFLSPLDGCCSSGHLDKWREGEGEMDITSISMISSRFSRNAGHSGALIRVGVVAELLL